MMIRACILSIAFRNNGIQASSFIRRRPPCASTPQNVRCTSNGFQIECYMDRNGKDATFFFCRFRTLFTYHEGLCHQSISSFRGTTAVNLYMRHRRHGMPGGRRTASIVATVIVIHFVRRGCHGSHNHIFPRLLKQTDREYDAHGR